jgi:hypothetical protein
LPRPRLTAPYRSIPSRDWIKVKNPPEIVEFLDVESQSLANPIAFAAVGAHNIETPAGNELLSLVRESHECRSRRARSSDDQNALPRKEANAGIKSLPLGA